jgi:hypothetical protein
VNGVCVVKAGECGRLVCVFCSEQNTAFLQCCGLQIHFGSSGASNSAACGFVVNDEGSRLLAHLEAEPHFANKRCRTILRHDQSPSFVDACGPLFNGPREPASVDLACVAFRSLERLGLDVVLEEMLPPDDAQCLARKSEVNYCGIFGLMGVSRHKSEQCGKVNLSFHSK